MLAEHGGPFEFNAEDFRRRIRWGEACGAACDALSPSGNHRRDWAPSRVHIEPLVQTARPGAKAPVTLVIDNPTARAETLSVTLLGREQFADQTVSVEVPAKGSVRRALTVSLGDKVSVGRQVFALRVYEGKVPDGADVFFVIDVEKAKE